MAISLQDAAAVMREALRETVRRYSLWYLVQGVLMVAAGVLALIYPLIASQAIVTLLGWILIVSGVLQGLGLIGAPKVPHFWLQLISVALSILATVVSRQQGWYVLDAGSKAISQDFGSAAIKGHPTERVVKLAEEHTKVEDGGTGPKVRERREVLPAHCCATMNLHRQAVAVRGGRVEAVWPIEASGRYD